MKDTNAAEDDDDNHKVRAIPVFSAIPVFDESDDSNDATFKVDFCRKATFKVDLCRMLPRTMMMTKR